MTKGTFGYGRMTIVKFQLLRTANHHLMNIDAILRSQPMPFPDLNASSQQTDYLRYHSAASLDDVVRSLAQIELEELMVNEIHHRTDEWPAQ